MNNREIRDYIEIASIMITENEQVVPDDVIITESIEPKLDQYVDDQIQALIFKLGSYHDSTSNAEFAHGVEHGMTQAANMLSNLLERLRG